MRRVKSDTSLLKMSRPPRGFEKCEQIETFRFPCSFDPMDSDTWDNVGIEEQESFYIPDAQPLPPGARDPAYYTPESQYSDSETYSEYPEPVTQTCPDEQAIHLTDLMNTRETLATLSKFTSGQIGQHLKSHQGLLILPLHAVSILRMPHGNHTGNYPVLIFYPEEDLDNYTNLPNFTTAVDLLYDNQ